MKKKLFLKKASDFFIALLFMGILTLYIICWHLGLHLYLLRLVR